MKRERVCSTGRVAARRPVAVSGAVSRCVASERVYTRVVEVVEVVVEVV